MPFANWAVQRAADVVNGARGLLGSTQTSTGLVVGRREPWFGPGQAQQPTAPVADVAGRRWDFPVGENMQSRPRALAGISFEQLRGLADNLDIARLCIETRKDQVGSLTWSFLPKQQPGVQTRPKADSRCAELEQFFASPDRRQTWDSWVRMLLEDLFVIDAPSVYVRRTKGGDVYALEIIDGATIKPLIDTTGREPPAPEAAYQQVLKGMPAINYSTDELIYAPRNRRSNHLYGLSVVEQIMLTVNIAIRREVVKLQYFTEGNIPEALISVPLDWSPEQILRFQTQFDALMRDSAARARLKFMPGGMTVQPSRSDGMLMGPFDEWIARVVCFAFSLPPTAFVQQLNRSTAETAQDTAVEEGLRPTMVWLKGLIDRIVRDVFGFADIELVWDDIKGIDVLAERQEDRADVAAGVLSVDDVRAKRGLDPIGIGPAIPGGPNGLVFLKDLAAAQAQGLTAIQPPPAPPQLDEFGNPIPGAAPPPSPLIGHNGGPPLEDPAAAPEAAPAPAPAPTAPPNGLDPLAGIPADILAAVGLGPAGPAGRAVDVTRADEIQTDPEAAHVGHPEVLRTLRHAEALHKRVPTHHRRKI